MLASVLAASSDFVRPDFDWHALAPEIVLVVTIALCLLVDVFTTEQSRWTASSIAGIGMLAALVPSYVLCEAAMLESVQQSLYLQARDRLEANIRRDVTDFDTLAVMFADSVKFPGWAEVNWL